ncbi:MAG: hypothetical protein MHPSP_003812, partial [Paramarteilia canceri]
MIGSRVLADLHDNKEVIDVLSNIMKSYINRRKLCKISSGMKDPSNILSRVVGSNKTKPNTEIERTMI